MTLVTKVNAPSSLAFVFGCSGIVFLASLVPNFLSSSVWTISATTSVAFASRRELVGRRFAPAFWRGLLRFLFAITQHLHKRPECNTGGDVVARFKVCNFSRKATVAERGPTGGRYYIKGAAVRLGKRALLGLLLL